jgi:chemotaxis signal transduction protein
MLRSDEDASFFTGVCRVEGEMVFVVNLEALIDPDRSGPSAPPRAPGGRG